jgi:hypothetical protein
MPDRRQSIIAAQSSFRQVLEMREFFRLRGAPQGPYRAQVSWRIYLGLARMARFSPGYNLAGFQPSDMQRTESGAGAVVESKM